ncbi:hypothetical protein E2C01_017613 [Portunus trituberculatus]|uniref:Uncharacterized protein n=1 Tax=Portunus trituberculatus TaxID=210409 RepID=A0A5B7DSY0_PORTR|nr:hypothetical protein [Portunus trituberculatus]
MAVRAAAFTEIKGKIYNDGCVRRALNKAREECEYEGTYFSPRSKSCPAAPCRTHPKHHPAKPRMTPTPRPPCPASLFSTLSTRRSLPGNEG